MWSKKEITRYSSNPTHSITLHPRKYEELSVLKSLLAMFLGERNKPEVRFCILLTLGKDAGRRFEEYSKKDHSELPVLNTIIQGGGTVYRDESNRNLQ